MILGPFSQITFFPIFFSVSCKFLSKDKGDRSVEILTAALRKGGWFDKPKGDDR
jgi:hypothetical protein